MRRWAKVIAWVVAPGVAAGMSMIAAMYAGARADPVVRSVRVALPRWPAGTPPVRVALWSDLHLGDLATDPARLHRIADRIMAEKPDLVVIAGDLVAGNDPGDAARVAAPLASALRRVKPPLGLVVVPGNHDHWTGMGEVAAAVRAAGGTLLANQAVARGPLAIGGVDDDYTGRARIGRTVAAMRRLPGAPLLVSHSPDVAPRLPADVPLLLGGHSHCGQVVLPLIGPPVLPLRTGARYLCGVIRDGRRTVIVGAGTGTSELPLRLGAPPDVWMVTLAATGR